MFLTFESPRSISALKKLASQLRAENVAMAQHEALNRAANAAGFSNYKHAQRHLPDVMRLLTIRVRWRNDASSGVESLSYPFPWSADDVVAMKLRGARIAASWASAPQSLTHSSIADSQYSARVWATQCVRELMFMEATGLRPVFISNVLPRRRIQFMGETGYERVAPPGEDHLSGWRCPQSKSVVLLDEPYIDSDRYQSAERRNWLSDYGYTQAKSGWGGTYLPPETVMIMLVKDGGSLTINDLESKIRGLPDNFGAADTHWKGESESFALA